MFWQILNLNYQNFLYEFWNSHDSLCLKMGGGAANSWENYLPDYTTSYLQKPVMYIQILLPSIYIAYFHVTIGYNLRAGRIAILFVRSHTHILSAQLKHELLPLA